MQLAIMIGITCLAAISLIMAVHFRQRLLSSHSLLIEAANRFEMVRKQLGATENELVKANEKLTKNKDQLARLEKGLETTRRQLEQADSKTETRMAEYQSKFEKVTHQFEQKARQQEMAQQNLIDEQEKRKSAEQRIQEMLANFDDRVKDTAEKNRSKWQETKDELEKTRLELRKTLADREDLRLKLDSFKPEDIVRFKRKAGQYYKLYMSMKGMREMAEDRNRNWEVALQKLAGWIVTKTAGEKRATELVGGPVGPLVGEALENIGMQILDLDEEDLSENSATAQGEAAATTPKSTAEVSS